MKLNHQIFGNIEFNNGWTRPISITMFGKQHVLEINIDADKDAEFEINQEKAYTFFQEHLDEIVTGVNSAILSYYNREISDIVSSFTNLAEKQSFIKLEMSSKFILCCSLSKSCFL